MLEYKFFKDSLYIKLSGELDHATAPDLRAKIDEIIAKEKFNKVIFDMSALNFMDSTGVGLIIGRYKLIRSKNKLLTIKAPTPAVDKVLNVSGIYSIIPKVQ